MSSKTDSILKLSNYYVSRQMAHVFRTEVGMSTPFFSINLDYLHTCSMRPWQADEDIAFFFPLESFDKTQNSQRVQIYSANQIWRREKKSFVTRLAGTLRTRVPNFNDISPENGVDIGCFLNLGRYGRTCLLHHLTDGTGSSIIATEDLPSMVRAKFEV